MVCVFFYTRTLTWLCEHFCTNVAMNQCEEKTLCLFILTYFIKIFKHKCTKQHQITTLEKVSITVVLPLEALHCVCNIFYILNSSGTSLSTNIPTFVQIIKPQNHSVTQQFSGHSVVVQNRNGSVWQTSLSGGLFHPERSVKWAVLDKHAKNLHHADYLL